MTKTVLFSLCLLFSLNACVSHVSAAPKNGERVILSHGFARSDVAMWRLEGRLEAAGYHVCTI